MWSVMNDRFEITQRLAACEGIDTNLEDVVSSYRNNLLVLQQDINDYL